MKKRHSIRILLAAAALLLATTACTKDELADGDRLPEGQYPLEIARITLGVEGGEAQPWGAPATRVSEIADGTGSEFRAGDPFAVQIDGEGEVGTYTVQNDGSAEAETPLYWSDRDEAHTVTAWYPATDGTLDLSDQSQSLAYLLGATSTGNYRAPVTLSFTHALAKVRVTPTADALGEVQSLQLYAYTQCTYEKGTVVQGSQEGWIEMKKCEYTENGTPVTCWEANVVPGKEITQMRANGSEECTLSSGITPVAGKFYNITLNYDPDYTYDEATNTYEVYNANGLLAWNEAVQSDLSLNCTLAADITMTGIDWTPVGYFDYENWQTISYTGTFDGGGHTITGLTIYLPDQDYVGLIGYLGGTVQNLTLAEAEINGKSYVGGVAGANIGTLTGCTVSGTVKGNGDYVGGVAGANSGTVTGCYATGNVTGTINVGGVVGHNSGTLTACYARDTVSGNKYVGGVAGANIGTLTGCTVSGTVKGNGDYVGGVTGSNSSGSLTACYSTCTVTGSGDYVGGVAGANYGTVTGCYATGDISGNDCVGGVAGVTNGTVTGCYATGDVTGTGNYVGGVAGTNGYGTVTGCYWSNSHNAGIGNSNGEATKVDGTTVTWETAQNGMNAAIDTWNTNNPDTPCDWRYTGAIATTLPVLTEQQP